MPPFVHGYAAHVMDFPGTTNIHWKHFIDCIVDIGASLAYHGFKKIVFLNGHGSNAPNLDLAARRVNLETDAECIACSWWHLLTVDPAFLPGWRESRFPGGIAPRLRVGNLGVPVPGRGQRAQGADRGRRDRLPPVRIRLPLHRPVRATGRVRRSPGPPPTATPGYWVRPLWRPGRRAGGRSRRRPGNWRACLPSFARCRSRRAATTTGWRRACRCRGVRARRRPPAVACTAHRRQVGDAGREPARAMTALPATASTAPLRRDGVRRGRVAEHASCTSGHRWLNPARRRCAGVWSAAATWWSTRAGRRSAPPSAAAWWWRCAGTGRRLATSRAGTRSRSGPTTPAP